MNLTKIIKGQQAIDYNFQYYKKIYQLNDSSEE